MWSRTWVLALLVIPLLLLVAAGCAKEKETFTLRWGHYLANSAFLDPENDFAKKIEERTNGRVKIDISYAGALGKGGELLTLAGRGSIDMGTDAPGYYADQLPFWRAFQIPFVFETPDQAMAVLLDVVDRVPEYKKEMDSINVIWLFQQPLGAYYLTGPDPNCDTVAALKGKKIRSFGADVPKAESAIGAVPVTVLPVEVYEALQRGTIDYSYLNLGNIAPYKLYEVGKYSCGPTMAITGHNIVIGKDTWKKLPKDIQDIFLDQAKKTQQEYLAWLKGDEDRARQTIINGGGVIKPFPAAELAKWKAAAPDGLANWVKDMEGKGLGDEARDAAARWREIIGK